MSTLSPHAKEVRRIKAEDERKRREERQRKDIERLCARFPDGRKWLDMLPMTPQHPQWREYSLWRRKCSTVGRGTIQPNFGRMAHDEKGKKTLVWCPDRKDTVYVSSSWEAPEWLSNPSLLPKRPPGK